MARPAHDFRRRALLSGAISIGILVLCGLGFLLLRGGPARDSGPAPAGPQEARSVAGEAGAPAASEEAEAPIAEEAAVDAKTTEEASLEIQPILEGLVVGGRAPVEGAKVHLFSTEGVIRTLERLEQLAPQGGEIPDIDPIVRAVREELQKIRDSAIVARTDAEGRYRFYEAPAEGYLVLTLADGWLFRYGDVVSLVAGQTQTLDMELEQGAAIEGRVVDSSGGGLEGAEIVAEYRPAGSAGLGRLAHKLLGYINGEFLKGPFQAKSAADGSFSIPSLIPGVYDLAVRAPTGVEARLAFVETGTRDAVVYVGEGAEIWGKLIDTEGLGASHVTALVEREEERITIPLPIPGVDKVLNSVNRLLGGKPRSLLSSNDGSFRLGPLSPGAYRLQVELSGFLPFSRAFTVDWGDSLNLGALILDRGKAIRGLVLALDGSPIADAKVMTLPGKPDPMGMASMAGDFISGRNATRTDAAGAFVLGGLGKQRYQVIASARGYAPGSERDCEPDGEPLRFVLERGVALRGRVVSASDGSPLAGARVEARGCRAITDTDGSFELDGVTPKADRQGPFGSFGPPDQGGEDRPPTDIKIKARAQGYLDGEGRVDIAGEVGDVEISLQRAPEITGLVLDPDGKPAPGSLVRLTPAMPSDIPPEFDFMDMRLIFLAVTVSDLDGRFRFSNFRGGNEQMRYEVVADHLLYTRGISKAFKLEEGAGPASRPGRETEGATGGAETQGAEGPVGEAGEADGAIEVEVSLVRGGTIRGLVTDGVAPVGGATVRLMRATSDRGSANNMQMKFILGMLGLPKGGETTQTDPEGRFEFARTRAGDYVLTAEKAAFVDSPAESITLGQGEVREAKLVVDPGGEVFGSVVDPSGAPLADARIRLLKEESDPGLPNSRERLHVQRAFGGAYRSGRTQADGTFRFQGLPPGAYTLIASLAGFTPGELAGAYPSETERKIVLTPASVLVGHVVDAADGAPIRTFKVVLTTSGGPQGEGTPEGFFAKIPRDYADAEGTFTRDDLAPGPYSLEVRATGYSTLRLELSLVAGALTERVLPLARAGRIRGVVVDARNGAPVANAKVRLLIEDGVRLEEAGAESEGGSPRDRREPRRRVSEGPAPDPRGPRVAAAARAREAENTEQETRSEDDGSFLFEAVTPEAHRIVVTHADFVPHEARDIVVNPGTELELSPTLRTGWTLSGTARAPDGRPLGDLTVRVRGTTEEAALVQKKDRTASDGSFRLSGLVSGGYELVVEAADDRGTGALTRAIEVNGTEGGIDLEVPVTRP